MDFMVDRSRHAPAFVLVLKSVTGFGVTALAAFLAVAPSVGLEPTLVNEAAASLIGAAFGAFLGLRA
jgi:hypothetical protein